MNKYIALGNLTKDPELKSTKTGKNVCTFTLAVNNNQQGANVLFIDVETWGKVAENCGRFLSKGRKVIIEGRLQLNSWKSKDGESRQKIYCTADVVHFLSRGESNNESKQEDKQENNEDNEASSDKSGFDEFADIPF